jgi:hypothetical protein
LGLVSIQGELEFWYDKKNVERSLKGKIKITIVTKEIIKR